MSGKGFQIGEGYLDIEADTDAALSDVRRFFDEVDGELKAEEKHFSDSGGRSGKGYLKSLDRSWEEIDIVAKAMHNRAFNAVQEENRRHNILAAMFSGGGAGAADAARGIERLLGRLRGAFSGQGFGRLLGGLRTSLPNLWRNLSAGIGDLFSSGASMFSSITKGIADAFSSGLDQAKQIWQGASEIFEQVGNALGGIGGVIPIVFFSIAIPAAIGLAAALSQLAAAALALPAAIGVAAAALVPLAIGVMELTKVFQTGLLTDAKKFEEQLKTLSPHARALAKEVHGIAPALRELKTAIGEAFLAPLIGQLKPLATGLLPVLTRGLSGVAGAWGRFMGQFLQFANSQTTLSALNDLFATTGRIIDRMSPALIDLFNALIGLMQQGLPWVEKFAGVLTGGLQKAADWLRQIQGPGGQLNGWLSKAWDVGKKLWDVLKGLGETVKIFLSAFSDEGTDTLRGMGDAVKQLNQYLKSKEGAETLHDLGVMIHWAGNAFNELISGTRATFLIMNGLFRFIRGIGPFFAGLGHDIADFARGIGRWFADLGRTIWGGITGAAKAVADFFVGIGHGFVTAYDAVVSFGSSIVDWFTALPGRIAAFAEALPGYIGQFFSWLGNATLYTIGFVAGVIVKFFTVDLPNWISAGWNWAKTTTLDALNALGAWISALPGRISSALASLGDAIGGWFSRAWAWAKDAVSSGADAVWGWIKALPGRIHNALSALMDAIGGWFSRTWNDAKKNTSSGVDGVMKFIHDLPGKISGALTGAGKWLYNIGQDALHGLVNGLDDLLDWAVEKAKSMAGAIKRGFMHGLDIGSPSKAMRRDVGRWILPGVMQGMDDTMPDMQRYLGVTADMIVSGFKPTVNVAAPNVSVGGTTLIADLGDGIRQAVPVQIMRNPTVVSSAATVGVRQRTSWLNTARPSI